MTILSLQDVHYRYNDELFRFNLDVSEGDIVSLMVKLAQENLRYCRWWQVLFSHSQGRSLSRGNRF